YNCLNNDVECVPGTKFATFWTPFGRILEGRYAPTKNPIKAVNIPVNDAAVDVFLKNDVINIKIITADNEDIKIIPSNFNISTKLNKNIEPPVDKRYVVPTIANVKLIIKVIITAEIK